MKIAFDLRRINNPGIGRYMKCLVEAILAQDAEHDYLLILPPDAANTIQAGNGNAAKLSCKLKYYSVREQIELPRILRNHKVDLLHAPHFVLPLLRPCPSVVTIHDVIYLACKQDMPSRVGRWYYRGMMSAAVRLADRIITDSSFSKNDIVRYLNADPAKIEVIYPGASFGFQQVTDRAELRATCTKYRIERDYVLYAGIYKPRKNHAGLLRAFQRFLAAGGEADLVIAGPTDEGQQQLLRLADELDIGGRVIFTGFVTDADLRALYSAARLYACPSLYEGFGFTPLEAMACGTPVVCSTETSLPEVAADAAFYADPRNAEAFAHAMYQVFTDKELRSTLKEKGYNNLRRFSWETTAKQTLAVYRAVLGSCLSKTVTAQ